MLGVAPRGADSWFATLMDGRATVHVGQRVYGLECS